MNPLKSIRKGGLSFTIFLILLVFAANQGIATDSKKMGIEPTFHTKGPIPLTPSSSTTLEIAEGRDFTLTTVLCLGEGTLEVELTKDDTEEDLVSMFLIGFNADPTFIPNSGITPAEISVSTDILSNFGIVFIVTNVASRESGKYKLSLALE